MGTKMFERWCENLLVEYVARTGRPFPRDDTFAYEALAHKVNAMTEGDVVLDPSDAVTVLIEERYLRP